MYGFYIDVDRYVDNYASDVFALEAKKWHEEADKLAAYKPRLAARTRDVAKALQALNMLARDMKAQRSK